MGVTYSKLWSILYDRKIKKMQFKEMCGFSNNTLSALGKDQPVSLETIEKICKKLNCKVDDILEFKNDNIEKIK